MDTKVIARGLLVLPLLAGLSFCQTTAPTGSLCSIGPFIPDPGAGERFTREEKEYVVTLNESGVEICHWQAPA